MSPQRATLSDAIAGLARLQATFASDDRDDGWRQRLVQRRRLLQGQIAEVAGAWQAIERDYGQTAAVQRFREALMQIRARIAGHQASWPAVSIDAADPRFIESRDAARAASVEFHAAAAALLAEPNLPL